MHEFLISCSHTGWYFPFSDNATTIELNDLYGHFRNIAYNSVRWACLVSLAPKREKKEVLFSMAIANGELMHECFPKQRQTKKVRKEARHERKKSRRLITT